MLCFFEFIRVPQVSKVRFSSAPWMVSLHPWWVVSSLFSPGLYNAFSWGLSLRLPSHSRLQLFLCQLSVGNGHNSKARRIVNKKTKKSAFFKKNFSNFHFQYFTKDLLINHFKLKCVCKYCCLFLKNIIFKLF